MASKHKGKYHVVIFLCHSCFYSTYTFVPYIISLFQLPIISFHLIRLSLLYMQEGNIWWCKQKKDIVARIYFPLCDLLLRYGHETKRSLTLVSLPRLIVILFIFFRLCKIFGINSKPYYLIQHRNLRTLSLNISSYVSV